MDKKRYRELLKACYILGIAYQFGDKQPKSELPEIEITVTDTNTGKTVKPKKFWSFGRKD